MDNTTLGIFTVISMIVLIVTPILRILKEMEVHDGSDEETLG